MRPIWYWDVCARKSPRYSAARTSRTTLRTWTVIIINADKVKLNGGKMEKREYLRFTGYPGGQRAYTPGDLMKKSYKVTMQGKHPLFIKVVKGMLPKNKLGAKQLTNLHVFNGPEHPFADKNPEVLDLNKKK